MANHLTESGRQTFPASALLKWFERNRRDLPWRHTKDPYRIWISEVMLQQTRVETVVPYYKRFIERFPTAEALASADRRDLLRLWEGLGYYSRARNLQDAARNVVESYAGVVPDDYRELISLKGIGPYTAAAILSIAFQKPHAVVDGNVIRVLSRYFGFEEDVRSQAVKKRIQEMADSILDHARPGDFNQAVMELGATLCVPVRPECGRCPLSGGCVAMRIAATDRIPWKSPQQSLPHHQIGVGILVDKKERTLIALRPEESMLGGLWEFPGKQKPGESIRATVRRELREELGVEIEVRDKFMEIKHSYSHFRITLHAFLCRLTPEEQSPQAKSATEIRWVPLRSLNDFPFPKANRKVTEELIRKGVKR